LGEDHGAEGEITIIKEEIDRVGNILLRLKEPTQQLPGNGTMSINTVIESIGRIFSSSLCVAKQISLKVNLDPAVTEIQGNGEHLKQVVTNLLKNAVEALPIAGHITVSTEASVSFGGRQFIGIYIEDNGPGIAEPIKQQLFSPLESSKGSGHSGLGLSIVKKLIDEMGGSIVCRSHAKDGTQFQILLPAA
jgi:nitrogen-specific signal transduction histidine kinase